MTMKRFFNMTTSDDGISTIFLYGDIGEYDQAGVQSERIARELMEAERVSRHIHVRINSYGGDVYAGIAIFNALRRSRADIRIYVDGIAASMGSVIALCGKPVEMSRYARLMIHSVSGGCYGNKRDMQQCIDEIESLEDSLADIYAGRMGMDREEVKRTYFDGEDHWLTAQQALDLGLTDGIYDADPVPADSTPAQIYTLFNNRLEQPQNHNDTMELEEIRKRPRFKDCATDADVLRTLDELVQEADELRSRNRAFEDRAKAEAAAECRKLLDEAQADGRIDAVTRPVYERLLASDPENGKKALATLAPKRKVLADLNLTPGGDTPWNKRMKDIKNKLNKR